MACESPKEAWEKLKEEFEGNKQTRLMQVLNLKRKFEVQKMKESESIEEYGSKLISIVNQIRLLGEKFPDERIVEKLLVNLPERYEAKISSLEDSKDLSKLTVAELINAFQAVEQRRAIRQVGEEGNVEGALMAKTSSLKHKGKIP